MCVILCEQCEEWLLQALRPASYTGLIADHNEVWSEKFRSSPTAYHVALRSLVDDLRTELRTMPKPVPVESKKPGGLPSTSTPVPATIHLTSALATVEASLPEPSLPEPSLPEVEPTGGASDHVVADRVFDVQDTHVRDRW